MPKEVLQENCSPVLAPCLQAIIITSANHFCIQMALSLSGEAVQSARSLPLVNKVMAAEVAVPVNRNDTFTSCSVSNTLNKSTLKVKSSNQQV